MEDSSPCLQQSVGWSRIVVDFYKCPGFGENHIEFSIFAGVEHMLPHGLPCRYVDIDLVPTSVAL